MSKAGQKSVKWYFNCPLKVRKLRVPQILAIEFETQCTDCQLIFFAVKMRVRANAILQFLKSAKAFTVTDGCKRMV